MLFKVQKKKNITFVIGCSMVMLFSQNINAWNEQDRVHAFYGDPTFDRVVTNHINL